MDTNFQPEDQTTLPQTTAPVSKSSNGLLMVVGVLLLLSLMANVYFFSQMFSKNQLEQPKGQQIPVIQTEVQPTSGVTIAPTIATTIYPQADVTKNWKTYNNSALGFELKYPPTVKIEKELNDQYNRVTIFNGGNLDFEVMLRNAGATNLEKYYFMDSPITRKVSLDGVTANVYELPNGYCDGPSCSKPFISIVTKHNSDFYHLSFFGDAQLSDIENQILSTFNFTTNEKP